MGEVDKLGSCLFQVNHLKNDCEPKLSSYKQSERVDPGFLAFTHASHDHKNVGPIRDDMKGLREAEIFSPVIP